MVGVDASMTEIKDISDEVQALINKGKRRGYVTYEAVSYTHLTLPTTPYV